MVLFWCNLTPDFPSNPFLVDEWFMPYVNPIQLIVCNQNYDKHQINMDIYT